MNKELLLIDGLLLLLKRDEDPTKRERLIASLEAQQRGPDIVGQAGATGLDQNILDSLNAPSGEFSRRMEEGPQIRGDSTRRDVYEEQLSQFGFVIGPDGHWWPVSTVPMEGFVAVNPNG